MDGFKTARVLVLDDQPEQAMPVIQALGLLGIGAIYHDGSVDTVYEQKLTGVRVMFVDMVLANHGADVNNPQACVEMVTETLSNLVEDSCDPVIVVCWTGHEKMTTGFQSVLKKRFPKAKIDDVIVAEKSKYERPEDVEKLKELILKALAAQNPINVLFQWEQLVHDAATQTTGTITRLVQQFGGSTAESWSKCAYQICAALALAERGSRLIKETEQHATKALFDALNPLLTDRLDHSSIPVGSDFKDVSKNLLNTVKDEYKQQDTGRKSKNTKRQQEECNAFVRKHFSKEVTPERLKSIPQIPDEALSLLSSELRAALNTMLHISDNATKGEVCPGNIFFMEFDCDNGKKLRERLSKKYWEHLRDDSLFLPSGKLPENYFPLLLEFSATCDFAQAKTKLPRFVAGFLVPEDGIESVKVGEYNRLSGPLILSNAEKPKLDGVYWLMLNAHFIHGFEPKFAADLIPTYRLRTAILADLTAWISSHIGRPGMLNIGP
jgi:hypothetical protein